MSKSPPRKRRRLNTDPLHHEPEEQDISKKCLLELTAEEFDQLGDYEQFEKFVDEFQRRVHLAAEGERVPVVSLPSQIRQFCSRFPSLQKRLESLDLILRLSPHITVRNFDEEVGPVEDSTRQETTRKQTKDSL